MDFTRISVTQNNLQQLKEVWDQLDDKTKQLFYCNYGDLSYLLDVKVDKHLFKLWPNIGILPIAALLLGRYIGAYHRKVHNYAPLPQNPSRQAYSRASNVHTFLKRLMSITGMSEQWVAARIKQKVDSKCIPWKSLQDLILAHPDKKKRVNVFPLSIYRSLVHAEEQVKEDLSVWAQLLLAWFHGHFWKVEKVSYQIFSKNYSSLKEFVATPRQDNIFEEKWMAIL
ncbi:hypothetical protein CXB51_025974 [Gossypium anomalum]|uniref:Uncharacterized protein n=1 Tax=Gossypium anomalum TaxID=47600 RepID=A0A8J5YES7_9ROSI|nr:hypothetical protein CXB51_025974 [Gossypium anomalum]